MIEITRALARLFLAVLRKSAPAGAARGVRPPLTLQAGRDGLRVQALHPEIAVAYHLPGPRSPAGLTLGGEALDDFEGRNEDVVVLESTGTGAVQARWNDGGVPMVRDYNPPDPGTLPALPDLPKTFASAGSEILRALDNAVHCAARESSNRFAVSRLQLRGKSGEVVGTDGHQLLVQRGFKFPWHDDVLIPAAGIFGCRELVRDVEVEIGRSEKHVCLRIGPWTIWLTVDPAGRFPKVESVIPARTANATTCRLNLDDATFLARALPRLPGSGDDDKPVTVDLNGHVIVRARGQSQDRPTELTLAGSEVDGPPVCFVTDRRFLARAVALGFTEFQIGKSDTPVVARDGARTYVWVPLAKDGAVPHSDDAIPVVSEPSEKHRSQPNSERPVSPMSNNGKHDNGKHDVEPVPAAAATNGETHTSAGSGTSNLIDEAQALTVSLREAYGRATRLLAGLKRQRKQSRLVSSTLASLRQLQQLDG